MIFITYVVKTRVGSTEMFNNFRNRKVESRKIRFLKLYNIFMDISLCLCQAIILEGPFSRVIHYRNSTEIDQID